MSHIVFLGGFSNFISIFSLSANGNLSFLSSVTTPEIYNPSWLSIPESKTYLYSLREESNYEGNYTGAVSAYRISENMQNLTLINTGKYLRRTRTTVFHIL